MRRMNAVTAEGIEILSFRQISEEKKATGMAIVAAADYLVSVRKGTMPDQWKEQFTEFLSQKEIRIVKQTKRSEQEVDIRPWIYQAEIRGEQIYLHLAAGSVQNLKPDLVMEAFCKFCGIQEETVVFSYHRLEMYAESSENKAESAERFVTLESLGEEICSEKC